MVIEVMVGPTEAPPARRRPGRRDARPERRGARPDAAAAPSSRLDPAAALVESLLFVAQGPVGIADLARALELPRPAVMRAIDALAASLEGRGLRVQRGEGTVRLVTAPEAAPAVQRFLGLELAAPLTRAALETLSIIAYRQPLTRPEIDDLRGVSSDGVLRTLLARGLVEPVGRRETVGLPYEYGTTYAFLDYFGLGGLDELPPLGTVLGAEPDAAEPAEPADGEGGEAREWAAFGGRSVDGAPGVAPAGLAADAERDVAGDAEPRAGA